MPVLGLSDLKDLTFPTLWNSDEINKIRMQEGVTFDTVLGELRAALAVLTGSLTSMPHYSDLFAVQDEMLVEYPVGSSNGFERSTEYGLPTPKRGTPNTGHMLPLDGFDRGMGWTQLFLRKSKRAQIETDLRSAITDGRNLWQQSLLNRFFKKEAENVGAGSGSSVPLADGGTADAAWVPMPSPEGKTFLNTHNHYTSTATHNNAAVNAMVAHLQEHGHTPPFDIVGSLADSATWGGLTMFKAPNWPGIIYQDTTINKDRSTLPDQSMFYGYILADVGVCRLWLSPRLPTKYFGCWKSYGAGDRRNPVRIRIDRNSGFGFDLVPGQYVNNPMEFALCRTEYGVGIGEDRTNGVCVFIDAGSYVTPTIS